MKLTGRRESQNVEDRRGLSSGAKAGLGGGIIAAILGIVMSFFSGGGGGIDLGSIISGGGGGLGDVIGAITGGGSSSAEQVDTTKFSEEEKALAHECRQILASTEDVWAKVFQEYNLPNCMTGKNGTYVTDEAYGVPIATLLLELGIDVDDVSYFTLLANDHANPGKLSAKWLLKTTRYFLPNFDIGGSLAEREQVPTMLALKDSWNANAMASSEMNSGTRFRLMFGSATSSDGSWDKSIKFINTLNIVLSGAPPSEHGDFLRLCKLFKNPACIVDGHLVLRQEKHADTVLTGPSQEDPLLPRPGGKELMRNLGQNAHPVSGRSRRVAAGPVSQALHNGQRLIHSPVGCDSPQIRHGPHAAAFMLHFLSVKRIKGIPHVHSPIPGRGRMIIRMSSGFSPPTRSFSFRDPWRSAAASDGPPLR